MRTWKMTAWMCGAVLCCAVPGVFCQTLSGSLAAGTGLSADAPQGGSGMGSIGASSHVSASASSTMNAEVGASMDAEGVYGAAANGEGSGAGAGSAHLDFRIGLSANSARNLNKLVDGGLGFGLERGPAVERGPESKTREAMPSTRTDVRNGPMQAGQRRSVQVLRARNGSAKKLSAASTRQLGGDYSKDFPDSTKGTALLSPPDSTASPLDWTPGLNFSFPDFAEQSFLKPSLHGGSSAQRRRVAARAKAPVLGGIPSGAPTHSDLSTSLDDSLRVRVPDPLADLQSH